MSNKKKRNKKYHGSTATTNRPTITRVNAVKHHPVHQWWLDHKRVAKPIMIAAAIAAVIVIVLIGIIDLFI